MKRRLVCWCDDIVSIDQSKDDILIFVIVVTPYWHLPVDLSFLDEKVVVWWLGRQGETGTQGTHHTCHYFRSPINDVISSPPPALPPSLNFNIGIFQEKMTRSFVYHHQTVTSQ